MTGEREERNKTTIREENRRKKAEGKPCGGSCAAFFNEILKPKAPF
jgi:hypothetical protein